MADAAEEIIRAAGLRAQLSFVEGVRFMEPDEATYERTWLAAKAHRDDVEAQLRQLSEANRNGVASNG